MSSDTRTRIHYSLTPGARGRPAQLSPDSSLFAQKQPGAGLDGDVPGPRIEGKLDVPLLDPGRDQSRVIVPEEPPAIFRRRAIDDHQRGGARALQLREDCRLVVV